MTPEEVPAELVKLIKLKVGSPLPCMSHDETDDVYREILAFVLPEHEKQLTADRDRAREIAVALEQENAEVQKIHHRSLFPATSGEWRGKHYCPACTYTDDGWTAYAVWPCATGAVFEGREAL
jgi:hypothetical protein